MPARQRSHCLPDRERQASVDTERPQHQVVELKRRLHPAHNVDMTKRVPKQYRLVEFRFTYADGGSILVDVPAYELGRSGGDLDVLAYFTKRNRDTDPEPPETIVRTGRIRDSRTGECI